MQNYSPPVTRLKARALYLAAVAAKNKGPPGGEVGEGCRYSQRVTRLRNRKEESLTQRPSLPKSGEKLGNSCMRSAGRRAGMPCGPPLSSSSPLGEVNASALNSASASRSGSLAASHRAGAGAGAVIIGVDGIGDDSAALAESGPEGGGQAIRRLNGVGEGEGKGNGQVSKSHLTDQTKIISNPNPSSQDPNSKFSGHEGGCRIVHGEEQSGNLPEAVAGTGAEAEVKGLGGGTEDGRVTTSKESEERTDGKETEGTSINGKNEAPAGSARETVLGPIVKRNRRELKLSEEETAMAGAPQGPVYQVTVLSTDQFEPSPNPEQEMQAVLVAAEGRGDWADLYSALDSARRLTIFHRDVLLREEQQHLNQAVGLVGLAVGNLRSSMVRNALLCVKDMFSCLGQDMARVDVGVVVGGTLQRLAGDKRFICLAAAEALEAASRKGPSQKVLHAILPSCEDRNAEVSSKAALYVELCLTALGVGNNAGAGLPEGTQVHGLLRGMARGVKGKLSDGRTASKRALMKSRKAMGAEAFEQELRACLDTGEVDRTLAAIDSPKTMAINGGPWGGTGAGGRGVGGRGRAGASGSRARIALGRGRVPAAPRVSIREQMLAARKQQQEAHAAGAGPAGAGPATAGGAVGNGVILVS